MKLRILALTAPLLLGPALLSLPSAELDAQERVLFREAQAPRGWIGISFDVISDNRGRVREIIISEVSEGSPAEEAGVRAGDQLLAINELRRAEELATLNDRLHLESGDEVVMEIQRDGDRRRVRLKAERRPDAFAVGRTVELSLEAESMVETWVRAMDSLRLELVAKGGPNVRVRQTSQGGARIRVVTSDGSEPETVVAPNASPVRVPFEFFVFRGEAHDSLRKEMVEVNRVASELGERLALRQRELRREFGDQNEMGFGQDYEFRQLRTALEQVSTRSLELETAMAEAARHTAGFKYAVPTPDVSPTVVGARAPEAPEFRPLTPYLVGRNRVAGAEVVDLQPELAQYFEVAGGVLVVDVAAGTPAAMAGIIPGDVITRIDQVGVRSVEDLRFGVSVAGDSLPVAIIRQGNSMQVLLRR
jgi:S1-C subfamily serine protease